MCANFQAKQIILTFLAKKDFGVGILKIRVRIWNHHLKDTMCVNFQAKQTALTICWPKFVEIALLRAIF